MSDTPSTPPLTWRRTLRRYVLGPGLAVLVMVILILNYAGLDPKIWKDADSASFQTAPEGDDWEPFTFRRLRIFQEAREPVLVHVVASWSPAAAESRVALCTSEPIQAELDQHKVRKLLADVSGPSPDSTELLRLLGEEETPTVAIYLPGKPDPIVRAGVVDLAWLRQTLAKTNEGK